MPAPLQTLARDLFSLVLVAGMVILALRGLDVLPQALAEPAGGVPFRRIGDVERRLGERLIVPVVFPRALRWPPARIRTAGSRPTTVLLAFTGREDGVERLLFAQTVSGGGGLVERLWPGGTVLAVADSEVGGGPATVSRVLGEDGRIWHEVRWTSGERSFALRGLATADVLLQLARSARREGP